MSAERFEEFRKAFGLSTLSVKDAVITLLQLQGADVLTADEVRQILPFDFGDEDK